MAAKNAASFTGLLSQYFQKSAAPFIRTRKPVTNRREVALKRSTMDTSAMKGIALVLTLLLPASASADVMTLGKLDSFCRDADAIAQATCRSYIFGVVQGIAFGDSAELVGRRLAQRPQSHFCLPLSASQDQMVMIVRAAIEKLERSHPEDLQLPAQSVIGAAMGRAFPCHKLD